MATERRGENTVAACTCQHIGDKRTVRAQIHSDGVVAVLRRIAETGQRIQLPILNRFPTEISG